MFSGGKGIGGSPLDCERIYVPYDALYRPSSSAKTLDQIIVADKKGNQEFADVFAKMSGIAEDLAEVTGDIATLFSERTDED